MIKQVVKMPRVLYGINHGALAAHPFEGFLHAFMEFEPLEKPVEDPAKEKPWFAVIDKGVLGFFGIFSHSSSDIINGFVRSPKGI